MSIRIIQKTHGGPEVLQAVDVPRPSPAAGELLVRAHAASLNPVDAKTRRGQAIGFVLPFSVGWDFAGEVEQIGADVQGFHVGDRVFGMPSFPEQAGYGEYVVGPAEHWAPSPTTLDDRSAAAVPLAALTALKALREVADLQPGQKVLVHAAGGGVGHFAVQIAKILGAEVVATASEAKQAFVKGLGADEVIDYQARPFSESLAGREIDVVLDLVGGTTGVESVQVTREGGLIIGVPSGTGNGLEEAASAAGVRSAAVMVSPNGKALREIAGWIDAGQLVATVSETYPLADIAAAHTSLDTGRTQGKIVVTIP
ncbi:NADP-dependent oxidoreductase [Aeromicrobium sp.]|uniref:NADP-dependent oxidoreductase n=1 Tax=Aeromicrobium sp. TaxID=1871063 RepID=UPI0030C3EBC6